MFIYIRNLNLTIYDIKYMCCYFCTFLATGHLNVQCLCLVMLFILNGHLP